MAAKGRANLRRRCSTAKITCFAAAALGLACFALANPHSGPGTKRFGTKGIFRRLAEPNDHIECGGGLCESVEDEVEHPEWWQTALGAFGLVYSFIALALACDEFFVPSLDVISEKLKLSPDVAGATFMAAGGSAPEFFTSMIGALSPEPSDVGIAAIVGSAVFNVLFVIGACGIAATHTLQLTWYPLARDSMFYIIDLVLLGVFFVDGRIEWWEALILFLNYMLYCVFMKYNAKIQAKVLDQEEEEADGDAEDDLDEEKRKDYEQFVKDFDTNRDGVISSGEFTRDAFKRYTELQRKWEVLSMRNHTKKSESRELAAMDSEAEIDEPENEPLSLCPGDDLDCKGWVWYVVTLPIAAAMLATCPDVRREGCGKLYVLAFFMSIIWIAIFSFLMVVSSEVVGAATGIDTGILAMTLLAAGTSVPDLLTSVLVTLQGHGDMAVSSSIGSNIFDVTVGLPVPWLLYCAIHAGAPVEVQSCGLFTSILLLLGMLGATIGSIMFMGWQLGKALGVCMIVLYFAFMSYSIYDYVHSDGTC